MKTHDDALRKAAVLIAALDMDAADALLERMSPEQAGRIRRLLLELPAVDAREEQAVIDAFFQDSRGTTPAPSGVELALSSTSSQAEATVDYRRDATHAVPFAFLHGAAVDDVGELLAHERPQTVALVVSHLPAEQAAQTLAVLPEALQAEVVRRLARLDEADPAVIRDVERALERRFGGRSIAAGGRGRGVGAVRQILSEAAPESRRQWLTELSHQDPPLAAKLTPPTFGFDALQDLSDDSLVLVFQTVDRAAAAAALAGGEPELMARLIGLLPRAEGRQLRRAVDTLGPTRLSDVDAAQDVVAQAAHELETWGRLTWRNEAGRQSTATGEVAAAA